MHLLTKQDLGKALCGDGRSLDKIEAR